MSTIPEELLVQLENDNEKYFIIKGKDLVINNNNWSILQNDNKSTQINIIIPNILGGFNIDTNYDFYIDFLDGKKKNGTVSNTTEPKVILTDNKDEKVILTDSKGEKVATDKYTQTIDKGIITITLNGESGIVEGNKVKINETLYYVNYKPDFLPEKTYDSNYQNINLIENNELSLDYPSGYANSTFFKRNSNNLEISDIIKEEKKIGILLTWTIDKTITSNLGKVIFSIRIENDDGFKWQSNASSFNITSNLNDIYFLRDEIEENYIVQNRHITPAGEFEPILVKGDNKSNSLFYKVYRYFQGQDLLAEDKEVTQLPNGAFILNNGNYANIEYYVDDGKIISNDKISYDITNNKFSINDESYSLRLYKSFNIQLEKYENKIEIKEQVKEQTKVSTFILNSDYSGEIEIQNIKYQIILINPISIKYSEGTETSSGGGLPVFHRSIRFVFLSPNKEYGDWNEGQLEYVNNDYFIVSWTPDNRATRSAGELGYYIEFTSNENGNNKYSLSTLPSKVKVEDNAVGSASSDYLPHWVSYVENNIQDDVNTFMHGELQEDYNSFENELLHNIFQNYERIETTKNPNKEEFIFEDNGETFVINVTQDINKNLVFQVIKNNEIIIDKINTTLVHDSFYCGTFTITYNSSKIVTYSFTYESSFKKAYILKAISGLSNEDYRPLIPVFWDNINKLLKQYDKDFQDNSTNFEKYQNSLEENFGYKKDEKEQINLRSNIVNNFTSLFTILKAMYEEGKNTILIDKAYYKGNSACIENGNIIFDNGDETKYFLGEVNFEKKTCELQYYGSSRPSTYIKGQYYFLDGLSYKKINELYYQQTTETGEIKYGEYKNGEAIKYDGNIPNCYIKQIPETEEQNKDNTSTVKLTEEYISVFLYEIQKKLAYICISAEEAQNKSKGSKSEPAKYTVLISSIHSILEEKANSTINKVNDNFKEIIDNFDKSINGDPTKNTNSLVEQFNEQLAQSLEDINSKILPELIISTLNSNNDASINDLKVQLNELKANQQTITITHDTNNDGILHIETTSKQ